MPATHTPAQATHPLLSAAAKALAPDAFTAYVEVANEVLGIQGVEVGDEADEASLENAVALEVTATLAGEAAEAAGGRAVIEERRGDQMRKFAEGPTARSTAAQIIARSVLLRQPGTWGNLTSVR